MRLGGRFVRVGKLRVLKSPTHGYSDVPMCFSFPQAASLKAAGTNMGPKSYAAQRAHRRAYEWPRPVATRAVQRALRHALRTYQRPTDDKDGAGDW
jgi:hypothetical protein